MKIHFTEQSITQLLKQLNSSLNHICLIYEIGGCGNPLDGTVRLKFTTILSSNCIQLSTNWIPVYTEYSTLIYLDDHLTIDFQSGGYLIKSNNQIYGHSLSLEKEHE